MGNDSTPLCMWCANAERYCQIYENVDETVKGVDHCVWTECSFGKETVGTYSCPTYSKLDIYKKVEVIKLNLEHCLERINKPNILLGMKGNFISSANSMKSSDAEKEAYKKCVELIEAKILEITKEEK